MKTRLCTLAAAAACSLLAQTATEPETNLVVVVTATPITHEEAVSKDGAETVTIGRAQLAALNAQDLQTALRQVPGVTISRYSPVGSYGGAQGGSVYVRGVGTGRPGGEVRTYVDGAPRESGVWGHPLMDSVPVDFANAVTVHKNPQPGHYPGTFAAVDVETRRRTAQGQEAEVDVAYGRFNTLLGSLSAAAKEGPVDAAAGVAYKYSEGARPHGSAEMKNAFGRVGADLSETERLSFVYQRTESWVEDPGVKHGVRPVHDRFDLATDLYTLRFDTDRDYLKGYSMVYFEHGAIEWKKDHLTDGNLMSPAGYADTTWLNWGVRNRYDWNVWEELWLTGSVDVEDAGGHTANNRLSDNRRVFGYAGRFVTVAPYVGAWYDFHLGEDWTLTPAAGARYYFHDLYDDEWAPSAAVTLDYREQVSFFVNGSRGVHYPGIYTRAVANDFAKRTLGAEVMDYVSGGTKFKIDEQTDVLLSLFHSEVSDRIDKTATSYINSGNLRATGVELSAHWRPTDDLGFFGGGTWTNPETHPVSRLPRWTFTAGGTWKICDWLKWTLDGQYIGSMNSYSVRAEADKADLR
ncbi:MAG: TonB-dependent receptor, partial [Kiritimatiellia bacterium]